MGVAPSQRHLCTVLSTRRIEAGARRLSRSWAVDRERVAVAVDVVGDEIVNGNRVNRLRSRFARVWLNLFEFRDEVKYRGTDVVEHRDNKRRRCRRTLIMPYPGMIAVGVLEERLPASPFWRADWWALGEGTDRARYWPLSHIEQWIRLWDATTGPGPGLGTPDTSRSRLGFFGGY
jgi:hypothetical protein